MNLTDQSELARTQKGSFSEGMDAYINDIKYEQNPYPTDTADHKSWGDGWVEAERDDYDYRTE